MLLFMKKTSILTNICIPARILGLALTVCTLFTVTSCTNDDNGLIPIGNGEGNYGQFQTEEKYNNETQGMFILCEGNYGKNNSTLDYLNFTTGLYYPNVFESGFMKDSKKMGDTGNDIKYYKGKLWIVINASNKVIVVNPVNGKIEKEINNIINGRHLVYYNGFVYVSAYYNAKFNKVISKGTVYKINADDYTITGQVDVGYQPENMDIVKDRLYVANSGGYNGSNDIGYDHTISVIDINTFKVIKTIDVKSVNLNELKADKNGNLWVTSQGKYDPTTYSMVGANITEISTEGEILNHFDVSAANLVINDNNLYYTVSSSKQPVQLNVIDTNTGKIIEKNLLKNNSQSQLPITTCAAAINPSNKNIYLADAKDYISAGEIFVYDKNGKYLSTIKNNLIGITPAHICFIP